MPIICEYAITYFAKTHISHIFPHIMAFSKSHMWKLWPHIQKFAYIHISHIRCIFLHMRSYFSAFSLSDVRLRPLKIFLPQTITKIYN